MLDGLKARLDQLLRERSRTDPRAFAAGMREALVEAKIGLSRMSDALAASEGELVEERKSLADAERRGRLAAAVPDPETVAIAERFVVRHRGRIEVLERKIVVQRDELSLTQREIEEMSAEVRNVGSVGAGDSINAAWRDLEAAGGVRPDQSTIEDAQTDRRRLDEAIEAQLAYLKKKLGKQK